jgi:hypothetical protein
MYTQRTRSLARYKFKKGAWSILIQRERLASEQRLPRDTSRPDTTASPRSRLSQIFSWLFRSALLLCWWRRSQG